MHDKPILMAKQVRILTLHQEYSPRAHGKHKITPSLTLCGIWLAQQGFSPGQKVTVKVRERLLVIEPFEGKPLHQPLKKRTPK